MSESREAGGLSGAVLGALIGAAVGVGIGLLIAPERGEEFRRRVAYNLDLLATHLADLGAKVKSLHEDSEAGRSATQLLGGAERQAQRLMKDADDLLDEIKRAHGTAS